MKVKKILSTVLIIAMLIGLMPGFTLQADAASAAVYLITKGPGPTATANYHVYVKTGGASGFVGLSNNADAGTAYSTIDKAMAEIKATVESHPATLHFAETGSSLGDASGELDIGGNTVELGASGTYTINGSLTGSGGNGTVSVDGASLIVSGNSTSIVYTGTDGEAIRNDGAGTVNISAGKIYSMKGSAVGIIRGGTVTVSGSEWNETTKTGTLVRSDASGHVAIRFDAAAGVGGVLTVNGGTVSGKGYGIGGLRPTVTINNGNISAETGCALVMIAGTLTVNGGDISSENTNTNLEDYPGAIWISDANMSDANLYLNGGSVENTAPGCPALYCYQTEGSYATRVYLSGAPAVSGTADIWTNTPIYADDGTASPVNYTGSPLSVEYGGTITAGVTAAVSHVSSGVNNTLFAISNPGYSLNLIGTDLIIHQSATSVILASDSFGTAGNGKITGLTSGTIYQITADSTVYYVKADGTLSSNASDAAPLTGTEIIGLTNGTTYMVQVYTPGGGGGDSPGHHKSYKPDVEKGASVVVDGQSQTAGTVKTTTQDGKTTTTITISTDKLNSILESAGRGATVTIPIPAGSDNASGMLDGQAVKDMENKDATLVLQTGAASYTLPASQIGIDSVSGKFGAAVSLSDIAVNVSINEPTGATTKIVEASAISGGFSIAVPAVEFTVSCTYGGKTVNVSSFNSYVERMIAIPDGVDAGKITTAVVVEADGSVYHVPTEVTMINGKYYAKINSLTNSTYSVIYNPVEFADAATHWAKDEINDMGSRLVVSGIGNENYDPNKDITRAEFAAIIIRALGLKAETAGSEFADVKASSWYAGYVETAVSYGIITGYPNGKFGPQDKITREQAMTMIARSMRLTGLYSTLTDAEMSTLISVYADGASASDYAEAGIANCLKTGVVSGKSSSKLAPKDYITRAEVAVIIKRMLKKSELI